MVYWQQTDAHALASVTYFSQQFVTMSNLQAVPQMFDERALLYRETSSGFYSELPYLAARCAVNACVQAFPNTFSKSTQDGNSSGGVSQALPSLFPDDLSDEDVGV